MNEAPSSDEGTVRNIFPVASIDDIVKIPNIIREILADIDRVEDIAAVFKHATECEQLLTLITDPIENFAHIARIAPDSEIIKKIQANLSNNLSSISSMKRKIDLLLKSNSHSLITIGLMNIIESCENILQNFNVNLYNPPDTGQTFVFDEDTLQAFDKYRSISKKIGDAENMPILEKIKSRIELLGKKRSAYVFALEEFVYPFIAIIGPSFMGKTQLAFNIARTNPVLYMNFKKGGSRQHVYRRFLPISNELGSCLSDDLKKIQGRDDYGVAMSIILSDKNIGIKFKSVGFIFALLERASTFDFNVEDADWMDFYVKSGPLVYSALTLNEYYERIGKNRVIETLYFNYFLLTCCRIFDLHKSTGAFYRRVHE